MAIDVIQFVNRCLKCKRMNRGKVFHHPARPLVIIALFERVAVDLVFGFAGILIITEYLSKYPFAAPLRSKGAVEIAEIVFVYITIFGPPKIILNDMGSEFMNEL